jgi:hypothetical protein
MENITNTIQLIEAIRILELKQKQEVLLLKEQFRLTYDHFKPVNLIKDTINNLITTPNLNKNILSTVLSIAAGYASKKIVIGENKNPIKQLLGSLLQMGVTNLVSSKAEGILMGITAIIKNLSLKKNESK